MLKRLDTLEALHLETELSECALNHAPILGLILRDAQNVELAGQCGYPQARLEAAEQKVLAPSAPTETHEGGNQARWWRRLLGLEPA